jgi:hypothetical protein
VRKKIIFSGNISSLTGFRNGKYSFLHGFEGKISRRREAGAFGCVELTFDCAELRFKRAKEREINNI